MSEGKCPTHDEYATEVGCESCYKESLYAEEREGIIELLDEFYEIEYKRLAHPYSKPMLQEQWGHLEGVEACIALIKANTTERTSTALPNAQGDNK